ncbi:hypothetical protein [Pseudomonas psychrophila]|uniref:Uncharacterized protein n=1 Tax=Pseudomonas psychrophila TaxID=122355 RepID=A0A8I1FVA1_9PSED|nr:hypothetical protein [Pseudomonas psychrophila]AVX93375.1 hypothetical protein PkP19E3_35390 [Pseudomonas koreensis]MBJ2258852.1 hypothetical protein [Pseudomonas psychrophila]
MSFHNLALLYANVATASVDACGCLLQGVGDFPAGSVRDEVLVALEEMNRSNVITDLVVGNGTPLTAHVVVGLEDGASGTEVAVKGVCFDAVSAMALAESAAGEMCASINAVLRRDMGEDFHPVGLAHLKSNEICIASPQTGCLASVEIQTTTSLSSENSSGSFFVGTQLGSYTRTPIL